MTKMGFSFIISGVFLYFLASQTQIGWLYLFDAIIWSVLALSAIISWYSLTLLKVERQVQLLPFVLRQPQLGGPLEDETVEIKLKVTNKGRVVKHFVKVLEECPFDQSEKQHRAFLLSKVGAESTTAFAYVATCYLRGHYESANLTLEAGDPLGLFVRRRVFQLPLNITVYPTYYQMERLPTNDALWSDWGPAAKSSAAAEFYGSREYQYGDSLKYIHWRNTARVGHFMLKEFEMSSYGSVTVAFPTKRNFGTGRETTLEYSIRTASSLAKVCNDYGRSIDILAGEKHLRNAGWREAMNFLAHLEAGGKADFSEFIRTVKPGQLVIAIVPRIETELIPIISQLSTPVGKLFVVLLEGFAPNDTATEFISKMKESNFDVISCYRGNLEEAIAKLGNFLSSAGGFASLVG